MNILVTGCAGFIGFHLTKRLLELGHDVIGIDNLNDYYDVQLKTSRLHCIQNQRFKFYQMPIEETNRVEEVFAQHEITHVVHLAAQAGVRYSLDNPMAYVQSNLVGFSVILETCRHHHIEHLIYASSSSVYGANRKLPFSVEDSVDHPVSLYAATKKSNELLAHSYSHLYNLPTTGLRFFTVYGPWGRPDMAYFSFVRDILAGKPIKIFNSGEMKRDFTYIDDIVEVIIRLLQRPAQGTKEWNPMFHEKSKSSAPYRIYNVGNQSPVELLYLVSLIEKELGISAVKDFLPMQDGDVLDTFADIGDLVHEIDYSPRVTIEEGIKNFVQWYKNHYKV
ncbi:MAG: NAD-dependent epimerase [Paenibacillus sp.]|uniref:NAD-dependent epimerase n=1 Tax=Paenibacillus sp. TaxID=58172 RepID=UPI00290A5579|nr:NAD-dependent epimerase [Paenibacillus sp.]MDU4695585.1 NAD-dependent epimerase [Paenibacillus sp.]